ncbi:cation diffusion facilitator family transporter [Arthrobacter sp. AET 35A]|uniref:cation diffusion facilitator family transporter n=1 Tax=Arthrobacter sp. AET 35A TaxID=2292643 RepID=UPI00177ECA58|nr:cation diffusion facilitator family transporter [Arthrobacter sp. AET 35A]MBE0011008.1 cation transporter [Arthrobacter sp. AET 35A]
MQNHDHGLAADTHRGPLAIALGITVAVFAFQVFGALWTGSLALLFDSAHVLTDAGGLAMALAAASLALRPATAQRSWGFRRAEVVAALAQAAILMAVGLYVLIEGIQRLITPTPVASEEMIIFGIIGLAGNIAALLVLSSRRSANFNLRAAFLEVLNDALGSVAVIVAAIIITFTGWVQADALVAMLIGVLILPRTFILLRETINVLLESTPRNIDLEDIRSHIIGTAGVREVHDLHITQIATGLPVLTAHVVVDEEIITLGRSHEMLDLLQECVLAHFEISIEHSTFQLEPPTHRDHEHDFTH